MEETIDSEALIAQLRKAFLQQNLEPFDSRDVSKIRNSNQMVLAYLKNAKYNSEKAFNIMTESLKWRKSFGVNDITKESIHPDLLNDPYLYFKGHGKKGESLLIWDVKRHKKSNSELTLSLKKLLAFMLDNREGVETNKKIIMLFNMNGAGLGNIDYDFIKYLILVLTEYYPDIIDHLLIFEMPRLLSAAWAVIKNMLDEDSRDAIKFVNKSEVLDYVDKEQLPISLGGVNKAAPVCVMENDFHSLTEKKQVTFTQQAVSQTTTDGHQTNHKPAKSSLSEKMQLLQITPADTLSFTVQQSNSESPPQLIKMTNIKDVTIAYKVKTTAPEHYRVKPTVGIIEPGQSLEVSVQLTPGSAVTASRDRFLVQSTLVNGAIKGDITDFWRGIEPGKVIEHRLKCKVTVNGSPVDDKLDITSNNLYNPASNTDRLSQLENRLKLVHESVLVTQKQVRTILLIIQVMVVIFLTYTGYILYQEYLLLQDSSDKSEL